MICSCRCMGGPEASYCSGCSSGSTSGWWSANQDYTHCSLPHRFLHTWWKGQPAPNPSFCCSSAVLVYHLKSLISLVDNFKQERHFSLQSQSIVLLPNWGSKIRLLRLKKWSGVFGKSVYTGTLITSVHKKFCWLSQGNFVLLKLTCFHFYRNSTS